MRRWRLSGCMVMAWMALTGRWAIGDTRRQLSQLLRGKYGPECPKRRWAIRFLRLLPLLLLPSLLLLLLLLFLLLRPLLCSWALVPSCPY